MHEELDSSRPSPMRRESTPMRQPKVGTAGQKNRSCCPNGRQPVYGLSSAPPVWDLPCRQVGSRWAYSSSSIGTSIRVRLRAGSQTEFSHSKTYTFEPSLLPYSHKV